MIWAQQHISRITPYNQMLVRAGDIAAFGGLGDGQILAWDEETWFHIYGDVGRAMMEDRPLVRFRYAKHDEKNQPKSEFWLSEINRVCTLTDTHRVLMADGSWKPARDLKKGDRLQHFCGNGHEAEVEQEPEPVGELPAVLLEVPKYGSMISGGIVLEAGA